MSTAALFTCEPSTQRHVSPPASLRFGVWLRHLSYVTADVAVLLLASLVAGAALRGPLPVAPQPGLLLQIVVPWLLLCGAGLYSREIIHPALEMRKLTEAMALASIVLLLSGPALPFLPGVVIALLGFSLRTLFLTLSRTFLRSIMNRTGIGLVPTIIVGSGTLSRQVFQTLEKHRHLGLKAAAVLEAADSGPELNRAQVLTAQFETAVQAAEQTGAGEMIVADPLLKEGDMEAVTSCYERRFRRIIFVTSSANLGGACVRATDLSGLLGLTVDRPALRYAPRLSKRLLDLCVAGSSGILLLPLFGLLYALVRLTSPGPAFYGQRRIGRHGEFFQTWKFRSMVMDADAVLREHLLKDPCLREEWEQAHKLRNDPRVHPVGRFLRKTSLDELPQLWNVLRGEMSLVGPRPIVEAEVPKYAGSIEYYKAVRPGVTGLWQISGRSHTSYAERVRYDEYFVKNWSIWLDLYILFRTVKTVLLREGAC